MPDFRLFYHFVWTTKQRLPLITDANQGPIYAAIRAKVEQLNGVVHALNGVADHIHLVVSLPPTLAPSAFIGQVKGSSSHFATHLGRQEGAFAWQNEYGVLTVSESQLAALVKYVDMQPQHHAERTLNAKLEPDW